MRARKILAATLAATAFLAAGCGSDDGDTDDAATDDAATEDAATDEASEMGSEMESMMPSEATT